MRNNQRVTERELTGLMGRKSVLQTMPVRWRIRSALLVLAGAALGGFAAGAAICSLLASW